MSEHRCRYCGRVFDYADRRYVGGRGIPTETLDKHYLNCPVLFEQRQAQRRADLARRR